MRAWISACALAGLFGGILTGAAQAAPSFDELLRSFGSTTENLVEDYTQPLGDAATLLAGSGAFHGASSKGVLGLDAGVKLVMLPVSTGDVPTGSILDQSEVSALGLPMIVANKGLIKGLQVGARFMNLELSKDVGTLSQIGASLRFEFNELFHVPLLMPRIGLQANYNKLKIGDFLETTATGLDLIVSKSFVILEPYAGLSLLKGTTDIGYTTTVSGNPESVDVSLDSTPFRVAAGLNVTPFPLLKFNVEYSMSDYSLVTAGILFNLF